MLRPLSLALIPLLSLSCSLYFEDDDAADSDADPAGAPDAALPDNCQQPGTAQDSVRACLSSAFEDYMERGLCSLATMNTAQGTCASCHASGGDGVAINTDCALTFAGWSIPENFEDLAQSVENERCVVGMVAGKVCSSELISPTHPPFVCPVDIKRSLDEFLADRFANIPCD